MKPTVAERIKKRLGAFTRDLESGEDLREKYTYRKVDIVLAPNAYDARSVKQTRKMLNASQAVFALLLGVSVKTVQGWEQSTAVPTRIACRFMDEIRHDPTYWIGRIEALMPVK